MKGKYRAELALHNGYDDESYGNNRVLALRVCTVRALFYRLLSRSQTSSQQTPTKAHEHFGVGENFSAHSVGNICLIGQRVLT